MLKFSQLNGRHEISENGSSYIWSLPKGRAMLIVAPVEIRAGDCLSFGHPNLVARIGKAFEYKHTRDNGSKRWTAAPGFEYWFLIPLDKIELIPEPGYSYVKVNIDGVPFTMNVSGGTSGQSWKDWVGDIAHLCGTRAFNTKLLNHLANAALPPSEIGNLEVHRPDERDRAYFEQLVAKRYGPDRLTPGCCVILEEGYSYDGSREFVFESRVQGAKATQKLICQYRGSRIMVKIAQIDWMKTSERNGWQLPTFPDSYNLPKNAEKIGEPLALSN